MALTLSENCTRELDPVAIYPVPSEVIDVVFYEPFQLKGIWWRVYPRTASDINFIQCLDHHRDKFCPLCGGGVLLKHPPPCGVSS